MTLVELLFVMILLGLVLAALTTLFVSGMRTEVDLSNRFSAQQNARLALDKLRREIHCAKDLTGTSVGVTLTLGSYCPTNDASSLATDVTLPAATIDVVSTSSFVPGPTTVVVGTATGITCTGQTATSLTGCSGGTPGTQPAGARVAATAQFTWCMKDKNDAVVAAPPATDEFPYTLWRYPGGSCSGSSGVRWVDHLMVGSVFRHSVTEPSVFGYGQDEGELATLHVYLPVDVTPNDAKQRYTLEDDVVLRNTTRTAP